MHDRRRSSLGRLLACEATASAILFVVNACSSGPPGQTSSDGGTETKSPVDSSTDRSGRDVAADTPKVPADAPKQMGWGDGVDGPTADILIADQFNNRVIEIDWQGKVVWTFGDGSTTPGSTSVVAPNDAERLPDGGTLISGSGLPSGTGSYGATEPACVKSGCPDNRVIIVDKSGAITWQYGENAGQSGSGPNQLTAPVGAQMLPNGNVLITDQGNNRIIEVTPAKAIAWQFPPTGIDGSSPENLNSPNSAQRLTNGNTLIADENNGRAIEVDTTGTIVWQYPTTPAAELLTTAAFASRLPNGNTLITDSGNSRVLEVTPTLDVTVVYNTAMRAGSFPQPFPAHAVRLADGDTLISDQLNDQVIEVNPKGELIFTYGVIQVAGKAPGELSAPYDAKVVGDYTGFSLPPGAP